VELTYRVRAADCVGCGGCLRTCPEHALRPGYRRPTGGVVPVLLADRCTGCGDCAEVCPVDAIEELRR
jgi:formate hydrogenlyase subunit 6/NADH:ubiquinone oxidoreductase subunit I